MLKTSNLPNSFWVEAIVTAVYLSNVSRTFAVWRKTPHEAWFEMKPKVSHLRVFGYVALVHMAIQKLQKLEDRAVIGIFIGYCSDAKAYRIYLLDSGKVLISRDVKFVESEF